MTEEKRNDARRYLEEGELSLELPFIQSSKIVFEEFIKIRRDLLRFSTVDNYPYYTLETRFPYAVAVLAETAEKKFILNEEYRHPTGKVLLSCPGGFINEGESPLEAARRELLEETGYNGRSFAIMGSAYPYPGISAQKVFFVKVVDLERIAAPQLEASEVLHTVIRSFSDIQSDIHQGKEIDGILCSALFYYHFVQTSFA